MYTSSLATPAKSTQGTQLDPTTSDRSNSNSFLPVRIAGAVEGRSLGFGVHVENVTATPGSGIGIILDGLLIPVRSPGHRVHRDAPQEANFALGANRDAFDERIQIRRISFAPYFDADDVHVRVVFIPIDGVANLAQRFVKLLFLGPHN